MEATEILIHCWQECKFVQTAWKTVNPDINIPCDLAILILGLYIQQKCEHISPKDIYKDIQTTTLYDSSSWKVRKCPLTVEWTIKFWYSTQSDTILEWERINLSHVTKWMKLTNIMLNRRSQTQKCIHYMIPCIWSSKVDRNTPFTWDYLAGEAMCSAVVDSLAETRLPIIHVKVPYMWIKVSCSFQTSSSASWIPLSVLCQYLV